MPPFYELQRDVGNDKHSNSGLGIDLGDDGVTANDADDPDSGANNPQNFPIIEGATKNPNGSTTIAGTLNSTPNQTFTIEVFRNSEAVGLDPSGNGEGQTFVGRTSVTTDSSGTATFTITDPGGSTDDTYAATATNDATDVTSEFGSAREANTAPSVTSNGPNTANEGETREYTVTVTDADADDAQTVTFECGDNGEEVGSVTYDQMTGQSSFQCRFPDGPATTTVSVTTDDGNDTGSDEITVDIANLKPSISLSGPATANEGETKEYTVTVTDPGSGDDGAQITTSCGANGERVSGSDEYNPATGQGSFECLFPDGPATTDITATVTDKDSAQDTDNQRVTVVIDNVPPAVELTGDSSANEGQTKSYTFIVTDPGEDTQTVTTSCGQNGRKVSGSDVYDQSTGEGSFECRFPDGPKRTTVSVTINDGTDSASDNIEVQISNRAPTANPDSATTDESRPVKINVLANDTDPGGKSDIDPSTVRIINQPANGQARVNSDGTITYTPRQGFTGQDTLTYRVCDEDGACSEPAKVTVTVNAADCTINARRGEVTRGTSGDDVICGTSANDVIYARGGNDIIRGGEGEDKLYGEEGSDTVRGEEDTDLLIGGAGPDVLEGGSGEDIMQGEDGNDTLEGRDQAPNDALNGGLGTDSCSLDRGDTIQSCP